MPRLAIFAASALLMSIAAAQAQGPKSAASAPTKPLLDNERMRISEMRLSPGAKIGLPDRPDHFAYLLTDATLVFSTPGKTPYQLDLKAGEATLLPGQSTQAENESGEEVRALLVEIKQPAPTRAALSKSRSKGKGSRHVTAAGKSRGSAASKIKTTDDGDS
jgi:hypothetical protein